MPKIFMNGTKFCLKWQWIQLHTSIQQCYEVSTVVYQIATIVIGQMLLNISLFKISPYWYTGC